MSGAALTRDLLQRVPGGMVETARRAPTRDFAQRCDQVLAVSGTLSRLRPLGAPSVAAMMSSSLV